MSNTTNISWSNIMNCIMNILKHLWIRIKHLFSFWGVAVLIFLIAILAWIFNSWCPKDAILGKVLIVVGGALIGAWVTFRVNEARHMETALALYASREMCDALRRLVAVGRLWKSAEANKTQKVKENVLVPPDISEYRSPEHNEKPRIGNISNFVTDKNEIALPWTLDQDAARRKVKHYFRDSLELYRAGRIGHNAFKTICDKDGINLLFSIVEPMEVMMNETYEDNVFKDIMTIMRGKVKLPPKTDNPKTQLFWNDKASKYEPAS